MKRSAIIIFSIIGVVIIGSCRTQSVNIVRIPVRSKSAINFVNYDKIFYEPVKIEKFPSKYDPGPSIDYFFLNEFPKTVKKSISRYEPGIEKTAGAASGRALLISSEVILKIKERNVIDEKKGKKKVRVFVKIENWELDFNISFKDMSTGKNIFSKTLKEKLNSVDKTKPDYYFEFLFRKITEKFVRFFLGIGRLETRFLIKKQDKK